MAYDGAIAAVAGEPMVQADDFRRAERLVVLAGGVAIGLMVGVSVALGLGRVGLWPLAVGAPLFALALYFAFATMHDALERRAFGCAAAAGLVTLAIAAWPASVIFGGQMIPMWAAPTAVVGSMALLASCWSGAASAVYRLSGQAAIVCAGAAYLGVVSALS